MACKKAIVDLYFDVLSPYSWIAFEALCRYRHVWTMELRLKPFYLAEVLHASGNTAPGLVPTKSRHIMKDLIHKRDYWGIPLKELKNPGGALFVKRSLSAQRYLTALSVHHDQDAVERGARELWMRMWSRDEDIHLPEDLLRVCRAIGFDGPTTALVMQQMDSPEIDERLKAVTAEAVETGAFGAPWIVVHKGDDKQHAFFGSDRMLIIADLIGQEFVGPLHYLASDRFKSR